MLARGVPKNMETRNGDSSLQRQGWAEPRVTGEVKGKRKDKSPPWAC